MKRKFTLLFFCLMANVGVFATDLYWVGPANGNWNNSNNWSATVDGPGGAGLPGAGDSVIISSGALVNMDVSPTIGALSVSHEPGGYYTDNVVKLYTSVGCTLSILNHLYISFVSLIDSTSQDVPFNLVLKGETHATGLIGFSGGSLTFIGRVPVTNGNGATLTAEPGSVFTVRQNGAIISGANSAYISCDQSSLIFAEVSYYIILSNLDALVPDATFKPNFLINPGVPPEFYQYISGASIFIQGKIGRIKYSSSSYRLLSVNLYEQTTDASLALPNGCTISMVGIGSTNGHTLTLFTNANSSPTISGNIGTLSLGGDDTKVALAASTSATAATNYSLQVVFFSQSGGNFSLQDYNNPLGGSTLAVSRDFLQTGGTFHTNSTTTNNAVKFVLEMNGGDFFGTRIYGTDSRGQSLTVSSGTINNEQNHVTLRINTPLIGFNGYFFVDKGVTLKKPLTVGRLELLKGPLNTSDSSVITVKDPDVTNGITTGITGQSYVIGPLSRFTNSTMAYTFPLGRPGSLYIYDYYRSTTIIPSSNAPSSYQAAYFNSEYSNLKVAAPLRGVSSAEYWNISKLSGAGASIMLPLKKAIAGASAADGIVVAHFVNGQWIPEHGTVLRPGTTDSGFVVSKPLSDFSPFTFGLLGDGNLSDTTLNAFTCPKDSTIYTDLVNCVGTLSWIAPAAVFPESYNIGNGDKLTLKGVSNGHAYYESGAEYLWSDARKIASNAGGYLVTINSEAENNFIVSKVIDTTRQGYRWIGLYNTGKAGQFSWVTGEPLSYTNWIPGEPDNYYNNPSDTTIYEPYVHLNGFDNKNRWNDIGNISARFLAEFDSHIDTYRQYSGPVNGQPVFGPTSYTICYERTNRLSGKRDSCCFTYSVVCKNNTVRADAASVNASVSNTLNAVAFPNPSSTSFSLNLKGYNQTDNIKLEVTDAVGRIVEVKNHISTKSQFQFGSGYAPGIYFSRITQGSNVVMLKLVKK